MSDSDIDRRLQNTEWVFGYGSLMWRPGFPFIEQRLARLDGYHRAACIFSHYHRGTAEVPGLVLGLDQGGECHGIAFKFDKKKRIQVIDYLNERELIGYAYKPVVSAVEVVGIGVVEAYTFVADPDHHNYAGTLAERDAAALIMKAEGISGLNRDYLINTVEKIRSEGFHEPDLFLLLDHVKEMTGELDQGGGI